MNTDMATLAQFGFAAVAFWAVWLSYRDVQPKLMDIVRQNAEAMQRMASAMEQMTHSIDGLQSRLNRLDNGVLRLEEQHKRQAECPFSSMAARREEVKS